MRFNYNVIWQTYKRLSSDVGNFAEDIVGKKKREFQEIFIACVFHKTWCMQLSRNNITYAEN